MASSGECLVGQIQASHFLCSFLLCIWVSASTYHSEVTSTALTFTVKPRTCCESARNSFWPFTAAVSFWSCSTPCLHVIELLFHMWLSCSLHFRFNQLRSDVYLLSSACDDLPCILDTIFIRLILDTSCRGRRGLRQVSLLSLIPSCAGFTSSALHLSVRPSAWIMTVGNSALCVIEFSKLLLESIPQLLRDLLIGLCAILLKIILLLGDPTCFGLCGPNDVEVLVHGECTVLFHRTRLLLERPLALSVCTQRSCFARSSLS